MRSWHKLGFGVAFAAMVTAASSCGAPEPSERDLTQAAAWSIRHPDATLVKTGKRLEQGAPAEVQILLADALVPDILAYYDAEVHELGMKGGAGLRGFAYADELYACGWHNGTELARLGFMRYGRAVERYPEIADHPDAGRTVFSWAVIDSPRTFEPTPCPPMLEILKDALPPE